MPSLFKASSRATPISSSPDIFQLTPDQLEKLFGTSFTSGLTAAQATAKLAQFGPNLLAQPKKPNPFLKFLSYFLSPFMLVLFVVGSYFLFVQHDYFEGIIVYVLALTSVILDYFQERRADQAVQKLQKRVTITARVLRDKQIISIPSANLVPGDILILKAGEIIGADGLVIESKDLFINQSALTGEAFPVEKLTTGEPEQRQVFDGTNVHTGSAKILVTQTGLRTEYSQIIAQLNQPDTPDPFRLGLKGFSGLITKLVLATTLLIFIVSGFSSQNWANALTFAVAVAIGITPEFLPMIMSICMSRGATQMAKKGVIVKKMTSLPSFGSMHILCTDKTGTLTEDRITLIKCTSVYGQLDNEVALFAQLNSFFQSGIGNAMDQALLEKKNSLLKQYQEIDEIPFDFDRRRSTIVADSPTGERWLITKGAPENIFPLLTHYRHNGRSRKLTPAVWEEIKLQLHLLSDDGFRVLAVAAKKLPLEKGKTDYTLRDEKELELLGFASFLDPLKKGVESTIKELSKLDVQVKVITGDNPIIAQKVCNQAGIFSERILLGTEIDKLSDEALIKLAQEVNIFARFNPLQKERIIRALKDSGQGVGYLGDGINDAPSLRFADVGISVANSVDVAREAADIILTQKSLRVLEQGIIDGRKTFVNTMKYVKVGTASSFGNTVSLFVSLLVLPFLPILPIQIILNDSLYDIAQMTLASDNVEDGQVIRPQSWNTKSITGFVFGFGLISSIFDLILLWIMISFYHVGPAIFHTAWFVSSMLTQMAVLFVLRTPLRFFRSRPGKPLLIASLATAAIGLLFVFVPALRHYFSFVYLPPSLVGVILLLVILYCVVTTLIKEIYINWGSDEEKKIARASTFL